MANEVKLDPRTLLSMSEVMAVSEAMKHGIMTRVVQRDGINLIMTEDHVPTRWDLEVANGIVVGVQLPTVR
jgi:hypothetical protein